MEYKTNETILIVSNIRFEPYIRPLLKEVFAENGINASSEHIGFGEYRDECKREIIEKSDCIAVIPNLEYMMTDNNDTIGHIFSECMNIAQYLDGITSAPILWFGFEDFFAHDVEIFGNVMFRGNFAGRLNDMLYSELSERVRFIDLCRIIASVGIKNAYDIKGKYRWNSPYSKTAVNGICAEIHKQYMISCGMSKKCLVLDCDNVLWGGIVSEDGIGGIHLGSSGLGREFSDFQRFVLNLYYHGVILAVCSKNDLRDVMQIFREHDGMVLREDNIAVFCVNWENKADNIRKIAVTLNIGLDSMVFVDDSEFEIRSINAILPEVKAILYDRNTVYSELSCFNLRENLNQDDVIRRNETYKTNVMRDELRQSAASYEEYLESLGTVIDIHEALPPELARISELTQRTNKCTNGRRYTLAELKDAITAGEYKLYTVKVSDRFSDLGVVGSIGLNGDMLELFSLSCRALGRGIEDKMLEFVRERNIKKFCFRLSEKNSALHETAKNYFESEESI